MNKKNLCVLFGGVSTEHDISLLSVASILQNLNRKKYNILAVGITKKGQWMYCPELDIKTLADDAWVQDDSNIPVTLSVDRKMRGLFAQDKNHEFYPVDCAFPVLHGVNGEDGTMQGLFEIAGIPYVGCGTASSAMCMDKSITKLIVRDAGVRQANWVLIRAHTFENDPEACIYNIEGKFTYPVFVKPACTGSSVGISKAKNREGLLYALREALKFDPKVLVEEFIDGREIETAVLGNEDARVSCCGEILPSREFYSYEAKYCDEDSKTCVPADLPHDVAEHVRESALKVYHALDCTGLSRVDFFVDRHDMSVIFNEINTIPGFTVISMYAKLFAHEGIPFADLLDKLIEFADAAYKTRQKYK